MEQQLKSWIDEKGKAWEEVKCTCPKCGGTKRVYFVPDDEGHDYQRCWKCWGKGTIVVTRRILTDKEKQYRENAKKRKAEKDRIARLKEANDKDKVEFGFITDTIYVVKEKDTYDIKEELKNAGAKWNKEWKRWIFDDTVNIDILNKYNVKEVHYTEVAHIHKCYADDPIERISFDTCDIYNYINNKLYAEDLNNNISKYMYNIKDRVEIKLIKEDVFGYNTQYGYMHIYILKDKEGNTYKWNTSSTLDMEDEKWYTVKATVKAHEEYKGEKQTVLTRCKIQEDDEESYEQNKHIESKTLLDDKIGEYNIQMISNIHLENLIESCTYLKITTSKNDIIYYNLYNCPFFDFKYKQGIKGITKIKKFIENDIYEYLEEKLQCSSLESYARKTTRQLTKQYL